MTLKIDRTQFDMAIGRDTEYHEPFNQKPYLDLTTGDILWIFDDEDSARLYGYSAEENKARREEVESKPDKLAEIPGLRHGEHHDILISFINSEWTDDVSLREKVLSCYQGSIGRWKEEVGQLDGSETILDKWSEYQERVIENEISDFFKKYDVEYEFY